MKYAIRGFVITLIIILFSFSYSLANTQSTNAKFYYKDMNLGILAYKQINAFKVTLADGSVLSDATILTSSGLGVDDNLKKVDIVFVIDTSGSMYGKKVETTKTATQNLVNSLFQKIGNENLKIGILYFNSQLDEQNILELTNNQGTILNHIDKIYANGGTWMNSALKKAKQMLSNENNDAVKIVCTLSDGALADEQASIDQFKEINQANISTISIFVETPVTNAFKQLEIGCANHKNFETSTENLSDTITKDIYNDISVKIILMSDPSIVYNINNAGIIKGDDKIILQADEEILHGATLEIEYIISVTSIFDANNIKIKDFFSEDLVFSQDKKLLTENKRNIDYGWKVENGVLVNDSGSATIPATNEYKVKLVLSTVFTPSRLIDLNRLGNYMTLSMNKLENDGRINTIQIGNSSSTMIKALDFLIIPPTGRYMFVEKVVMSLNITIIVVSIVLMIICIVDYTKSSKKNNKQ